MTRKIRVLAVAAAALWAAPARPVVPQVFTYSGYLKDGAGAPVAASTNLTFKLYTAPTGGTVVFAKTVATTPTSDGWFSVVLDLGTGTPAIASLAALDQTLYLGIQVEAEAELSPRAQVTPSLGALTVDWAGVQGKPTCSAGQFLSLDGSGNLTCATPSGGGGGVTSLAAGAAGGVTVSGSTGAVTVALQTCAANQILQFSGTTWGCVAMPAGGGGVSSVGATPPLASTGGANPVLSISACAAGQVLKYDGAAWSCAADAGIAAVSHDATLVGNGAGTPLGVATGAFQAPVTGGPCIAGQFVTNVNPSSGAITCSPELGAGTVTSVTAAATPGNPVVIGGTAAAPTVDVQQVRLNPTGCTGNQIPKWTGSAWACAADVDTNSGGTVTNVTGTLPISVATGTTTPAISIAAATGSQAGALSATDWNRFDQKQARVTGTCTAGSYVKGINADGSVSCGFLPVFANGASGATTAIGGTCTNYQGGAVTITAPGAGTISVEATTVLLINRVTGTVADYVSTYIGSTTADCTDSYGQAEFVFPIGTPTGLIYVTAVPRNAFAVPGPGTYTYYLNGIASVANTTSFYWSRLSATWYP